MENTIAQLRNGDKQAFDDLFHAFWDAGVHFVQSFLPNDMSADDIVQEVFLKIWDKRLSFENEKHFKAYFYKALKNNTLKHISRQKSTEDITNDRSLESDDFFKTIIEVEFRREINQAISKLPDKRKEVILQAMAGLTVEEIAENLNISVNTVKTQKKKAYATLRDELKDIHLKILFMFM